MKNEVDDKCEEALCVSNFQDAEYLVRDTAKIRIAYLVQLDPEYE